MVPWPRSAFSWVLFPVFVTPPPIITNLHKTFSAQYTFFKNKLQPQFQQTQTLNKTDENIIINTHGRKVVINSKKHHVWDHVIYMAVQRGSWKCSIKQSYTKLSEGCVGLHCKNGRKCRAQTVGIATSQLHDSKNSRLKLFRHAECEHDVNWQIESRQNN